MLGLSLGLSLGTSVTATGPKDEVLTPAYLTGTPMNTLELTVHPGSYSFVPDTIGRQMQASADGLSGWINAGSAFGGTSFVVNGDLVGQYVRVVETATKGSRTIQSFSASLGPVSAFVTLPSLPLAAGEKLWAIGDSQIGYNNSLGGPVGGGSNSGTLAAISTGYGFIEWAKAIDPRFSFDVWFDPADPLVRNYQGADLGVFGDHMQPSGLAPGIIPRIPALVAKAPKIVLLEGAFNTINTNDTGHDGTADYVIQQLDAGLSLLRIGGSHAILVVPYPTGAWTDGNARYTTLAAVQAWCRSQSTRDGVRIYDTTDILAPAGMLDLTMFKGDKIHLSPKGALATASQALVPLIQSIFAAGSSFSQDVTVGNLLTASQVNMDGTGGTMTNGTAANPNTGQVPTGYSVARGRNCSLVNSIDDYESGKHRLNIAVTPGGTDNGDYFEISVTPPPVTIPTGEPTKWYRAWFRVEIDEIKDLTFIELLYGQYIGANTVVHRSSGLGREASADYSKGQTSGPFSFWLTAPAVYNQSGNAGINGYRGFLRFSGNRAGSPLNIKISRPIIREVTDPRSIW